MHYKDQILDSIKSEFCIYIEKRQHNGTIFFRKGKLTYQCFDNELCSELVKYLCNELRVMYEGSKTEELFRI